MICGVKCCLLIALLCCSSSAAVQAPLPPVLERLIAAARPRPMLHALEQGVRVWGRPEDRERARAIAVAALRLREHIAGELKLTPCIAPPAVHVLLGVPPRLQSAALPPRAAFLPETRALLLAKEADAQDLRHELVHLALAQLCEATPLSLWLEEALAEMLRVDLGDATALLPEEPPAADPVTNQNHAARTSKSLDLLEILDATAATHADWLTRDAVKATAFMDGARALLRWLVVAKPGSSGKAQRDPLRALIAIETGRHALHGRGALAQLTGDNTDLAVTRALFRAWRAGGIATGAPVEEKTNGRIP